MPPPHEWSQLWRSGLGQAPCGSCASRSQKAHAAHGQISSRTVVLPLQEPAGGIHQDRSPAPSQLQAQHPQARFLPCIAHPAHLTREDLMMNADGTVKTKKSSERKVPNCFGQKSHWPFCVVLNSSEKWKALALGFYWLFFISTHLVSLLPCRQTCAVLAPSLQTCCRAPSDVLQTGRAPGPPAGRCCAWPGRCFPPQKEKEPCTGELVWLKRASYNQITPRQVINYGSFPKAGSHYHNPESLSYSCPLITFYLENLGNFCAISTFFQ